MRITVPLTCCIAFVLVIVAVLALFITVCFSPLHVEIRSETDGSDMFTWGDRVSLTAHLSSGIGILASYSWSLIPSPNSTHSVAHRSGAKLEFIVDDEFYFAVATYNVHVAYFGKLFATEANYTLYSYCLRNDSYVINSSAVVSWNVVTQLLVLRRSQLPIPILNVGDNLIHMDGLFLVNISQINQVNASTYSLLVSNTSIAEAFMNFTAGGDVALTTEDENHLERGLFDSDLEFSFIPFPLGRGDLEFSFTPKFSFKIENGSEVSVHCSKPDFATQLAHRDLIGQSFRVSCNFKFMVSGSINVSSPETSGEYTYYLYGGPDEGEQPKGKRFPFSWKKLAKSLRGLFKHVLTLRIPLRFKIETNTAAYFTFFADYEAEVGADYVFTQNGLEIADIQPVDWDQHRVLISVDAERCNVHLDLAFGIAFALEFAYGFVEVSFERLWHFPWYDAWDPTFKGSVHGVPFPSGCSRAEILSTVAVGSSYAIEIGLRFWKFGISKSFDHDFDARILQWHCYLADCSEHYILYSCLGDSPTNLQCVVDWRNGQYQGVTKCQAVCNAASARFSCYQAFLVNPTCVVDMRNGKYQGIDQCKAGCGVCDTCNNPACCNCPGRGPCTGACGFACPGDFNACCSPR
jgi:hypothetical protein